MFQEIGNEKIDLVITKDLSRLGRDYIMIVYYNETFPVKYDESIYKYKKNKLNCIHYIFI